MADLIGSNYLKADKVPDHVINYNPEPGEYSGMGAGALLDLKARALIQHARGLGNKDVDSVKRYIDSLDTLEDPSATEIQKKASSYFDRRRMSYEDKVTLDTLLSGGDFLDALATSLGATREETVEYLGEINSRRTGEPGQMEKVSGRGYVADRALAKNAAGVYSDWKNPVREYGLYRQDSAQEEFHSRSYSVTPGALGFLMEPGAAAEELLWHPANPVVLTPEESRLRSSRDRAHSVVPGGYEAFSPAEFARALSSVKHSLIRGLRKQDPSLTLIQAERLSNGLMIPMLEERSEYIRRSSGEPGRKAKLQSIKERFPLDRENSDQLTAVLRVYDGENNGTFERLRKNKNEKLADMWREAIRAVKQRFESGVYPGQIASVSRQATAVRAAEGAGDTEGPDVPVEAPVPQATEPVPEGGPRIVINPEVFEDKRDALCVAMNEAFRVLMEVNGFNPVSEPTEAQRQFFADTAYSRNENQMRRTILARICTFDTSVKDPTEEQLHESIEFLETVMEMGAPQNEWEQRAVQRIHDVLAAALENGTTQSAPQEPAPVDEPVGDETQTQAAIGGGTTEEEEPANLDAPPQEGENGYVEGDNGGSISVEAVNEATSEASGSQQTAMTEGASEPAKTEATTEPGQAAQKDGPQRDDTGYFRDAAGRVISQREAQKLWNANQKASNGQDQKTSNGQPGAPQVAAGNSTPASETPGQQPVQTQPVQTQTAQVPNNPQDQYQLNDATSKRKMTSGELAWHKRKEKSTAAWKARIS